MADPIGPVRICGVLTLYLNPEPLNPPPPTPSGYPALIAFNPKDKKYSTAKCAFELAHLVDVSLLFYI